MRKYQLNFVLTFFFLLYSGIYSFAQNVKNLPPFSEFKLGFFGGINISSSSGIGPSIVLEGKTNIITNLYLKCSLGYSRIYGLNSYHVNTYKLSTVQDIEFYRTSSYDVIKKGYDVIPFSLGIQYIFRQIIFSPYLGLGYSYNSIGTKIYKSTIHQSWYETYDELPPEFRTKHVEDTIHNSTSISLSIGTISTISSELMLDIRYLHRIDSELDNTHILIVGIIF